MQIDPNDAALKLGLADVRGARDQQGQGTLQPSTYFPWFQRS